MIQNLGTIKNKKTLNFWDKERLSESYFQVSFIKKWASCSERFLVPCTNGLTLRATAPTAHASRPLPTLRLKLCGTR